MATTTTTKSDKGKVRIGGSGFTWFSYNGDVVMFAQAIGLTSPQPVAQPVPVQPLNYLRPVEIAMPRAIGNGTLTVTIYELWNQPVWQRLKGMSNAVDLADVFAIMGSQGADPLTANIVSRSPNNTTYTRTFHGLKLADIRDDENIDITTMLMQKPITFWYTWSAINGVGPQTPSKVTV